MWILFTNAQSILRVIWGGDVTDYSQALLLAGPWVQTP